MANKWVDLGIGNIVSMLTIPTDKEGVAWFRLTDNDAGVNAGAANPVVKYNDNFRVHIPFALCQRHGSNHSWLAVTTFSTKRILEQGIVSENTCGKATAAPIPGEVIVFVRPLTFWEELKQ